MPAMKLKNAAADAALQKALLDTSAASTGDVLIPDVVEPVMRRYIETETPLFNLCNPRDWPTNVYRYRLMNGLPSGEFRSDGGTLPAPSRPNFARRSVEMKYLYIRGEVTGPEIAATQSVTSAFELSLEASGLGLAQTIEAALLTADSSVDPDEFDGLLKQITNVYSPAGAGVGTEAPLTLAMLDEALDGVKSDAIVMNLGMGRRIWGLLQAQQRFVNEDTIDGGFRVISYQGRPIYRLAAAGSQAPLANTVLMLYTPLLTIPILQDVTYEELAKIRDSRDYMLKMYLTLAVEGVEGLFHGRIDNVTSSAS